MTSFVRGKFSHSTLFDTIDLFSTHSGLKVNRDKTEILLLGNMEVKSSELGVDEICKVIKILGVNFTFNYSLFYSGAPKRSTIGIMGNQRKPMNSFSRGYHG